MLDCGITIEVGPYKYRRWIGRGYWLAVMIAIAVVIIGAIIRWPYQNQRA